VVVKGAALTPLHTETLGLLINTLGQALFCGLIFTLAVHGLAGFRGDKGRHLCLSSSAPACSVRRLLPSCRQHDADDRSITFAVSQALFARAIMAAMFASPAAFAGYHVILAMAKISEPSLAWREVLA
jgi:hypothetical protein